MSRTRSSLGVLGIVLLGLINGVLEDLLFVFVVVPYAPPGWDLTGDLFFTFTVPLTQLLTLGITGTLAWCFLGLRQTPRLIVFWACWSLSRAVFLTLINNPIEDVAIYLAWITAWCVLIGVLARWSGGRQPLATDDAGSISSL